MSDIQQKLRSLANAYPEDIFPRLTEDEREGNELLLSAAAAEMGRHFSSVFSEAADRIDELEALQTGEGESTNLEYAFEVIRCIRATEDSYETEQEVLARIYLDCEAALEKLTALGVAP